MHRCGCNVRVLIFFLLYSQIRHLMPSGLSSLAFGVELIKENEKTARTFLHRWNADDCGRCCCRRYTPDVTIICLYLIDLKFF